MNQCMLMAEVTVGPQLRYTQDNQTAIAELEIKFSGLRDDDPAQKMKVIGWGNLAQEMQERYGVGDRVLIEGRLTMSSVDRPEGFKEKQAELTAQRIHRINDLGSTEISQPTMASPTSSAPPAASPAAAAPAPAPAPAPAAAQPAATASEAEVDYDDIPF